MTKHMNKLLALWVAISAVVIVAGIVLFALMGFNNQADSPTYKTITVNYGVRVEISDREEELQTLCENVFQEEGLSYTEKKVEAELDGTYLSETGNLLLTYTFQSGVSADTLEETVVSIEAKIAADFANMGIRVSAHTLENQPFSEYAWRAAVAIAVGVVVALIYVGIRFGVGAALTGLTVCVHDVLFTLALFAITRIPVYASAPALIGGVAAFISLVLWLIQCMKLRENGKEEAFKALPAEEAVPASLQTAWKTVVSVAGAFAAVILILGAVSASGVMLTVLPMLLAAAVPVYSSLLLAPALHVHVKAAFDRIKAKRKPRYVGKKKGEKVKED